MSEKIKTWWSDDRLWFCVLADDGVSKATVSLTPDEAAKLAKAATERFPETSCSQCGATFGPGPNGFSHCDQHQRR